MSEIEELKRYWTYHGESREIRDYGELRQTAITDIDILIKKIEQYENAFDFVDRSLQAEISSRNSFNMTDFRKGEVTGFSIANGIVRRAKVSTERPEQVTEEEQNWIDNGGYEKQNKALKNSFNL